jgi:hypothetical protein
MTEKVTEANIFLSENKNIQTWPFQKRQSFLHLIRSMSKRTARGQWGATGVARWLRARANGSALSCWTGACPLARTGTTGRWSNVRNQVVAGYMLKLTHVRMVGNDTAGADGWSQCGV